MGDTFPPSAARLNWHAPRLPHSEPVPAPAMLTLPRAESGQAASGAHRGRRLTITSGLHKDDGADPHPRRRPIYPERASRLRLRHNAHLLPLANSVLTF